MCNSNCFCFFENPGRAYNSISAIVALLRNVTCQTTFYGKRQLYILGNLSLPVTRHQGLASFNFLGYRQFRTND